MNTDFNRVLPIAGATLLIASIAFWILLLALIIACATPSHPECYPARARARDHDASRP